MHPSAKPVTRILCVFGLSLAVWGSLPAQSEPGEVDERFKALTAEFSKLSDAGFGPEALSSWNVASAFVAKRFLARSISKGISNAGLTVSVTLPPGSFEAKEAVVRTD